MKRSLLLFFLLLGFGSFSQVNTFYKRSYSTSTSGALYNFVRTSDNGYIISSPSKHVVDGEWATFLNIEKTDEAGNSLWKKEFDFVSHQGNIKNSPVIQTSDGGYLIGASHKTDWNSADLDILKLNSSGDIQWSNTYNIGFSGSVQNFIPTSDGGYFITGAAWDNVAAPRAFIAKLQSDGTLMWLKKYWRTGTPNVKGWFYSIKETSEGDLIAVGQNPIGAMIVKTNSHGTLLWAKSLGQYQDSYYSVIVTSQNTYTVAGCLYNTGTSTYQFTIQEFDSNGNLLFSNQYGSWGKATSVEQFTNGDYLVAGIMIASSGDERNILARLDPSGNVIYAYRMNTDSANTSCGEPELSMNPDGGFTSLFQEVSTPTFTRTLIFVRSDSLGRSECFGSDTTLTFSSYLPAIISGVDTSSFSYTAIVLPTVVYDVPWNEEMVCNTVIIPEPTPYQPCLSIPNVFSPNGDDKNDLFEIHYCNNDNFDLKIYDRWGKPVFATKDKNEYWDGKNKSRQHSSDGTYYYILNTGEEINKGFITLVR